MASSIQGKAQIPGIQTPQPAQIQQANAVSFTTTAATSRTVNNAPQINHIQVEPQANGLIQYQYDLKVMQARERQEKEIKSGLEQEKSYQQYVEYLAESKSYRQNFEMLKSMNPDSFSITKAIFLIENAFDPKAFSYTQFQNAIRQRAELVKQTLKKERLDLSNNAALNYGIQKLYSQQNTYYDGKTKRSIAIKPLKYDFKDFMGESDYKQLFVSKLLMTGKGQCHSMPLLYLAIAEQLGAKAYLSLSPQHSFVQFFDDNKNRFSFEPTNGCIISQSWMMASGFINAAALKNRLYLDTLSSRELYAQCLADFLLSYQSKFGQDAFAEQIWRSIVANNPTNLIAKQTAANFINSYAMQKIKEAGYPSLKDLPKFPDAYKAYQQMVVANNEIDDLGFQNMPKEAYQQWRKSIEIEKKKQKTREAQEKMKREIEQLKKLKPKLTITPKG